MILATADQLIESGAERDTDGEQHNVQGPSQDQGLLRRQGREDQGRGEEMHGMHAFRVIIVTIASHSSLTMLQPPAAAAS